jgi:hypothetical protein
MNKPFPADVLVADPKIRYLLEAPPTLFTPNDTLMNDEVILEDKFFIVYYAMNFHLERHRPLDAHFLKKKV